jgi:hypothetical protein
MRVLVSDTSVLIDLERGAFLEAIFVLSYELAVPAVTGQGQAGEGQGDSTAACGISRRDVALGQMKMVTGFWNARRKWVQRT